MKTYVWQRSIAAWMFLPTVYWAFISNTNLLWLIPAFLLYLTIALTVTVGYHRLFTHNSFVCSRFWHWFFGMVGCVSLNAAPVHWSSVHISHHKYADTPEDPYDPNFMHFLRFNDRENVKATKNELRMMRDRMHIFFLNYSLSLSIGYGLIMAFLGTNTFLYLYALPVTLYLVTSGLHTIFAHGKLEDVPGQRTAARNLWLLEFLIPMGGEWIHKEHHDWPGINKWNTKPHYFDMGGHLIGLIERRAEQTS
jgi:stearoyl-CoA desaturase (delta-9 desaturase)